METPRYHRLMQAETRLEGMTCAACGKFHFPPRPRCPACGCASGTPQRLDGRGVLLSYSEVFRSGGLERQMPYWVGLVRLIEGVTLFTQLTDADPARLKAGMEVEAVIRKVDELEGGLIFYGYKFRPTNETDRVRGGIDDE